MIKNCAVCGKEFERTHYNQIYCSLECQNKGHIKTVMDRKSGVLKTCKTCGKKFVPSQSLRSYCSEECRDAVELKRREEYKLDFEGTHISEKPSGERHLDISVSNANKLGLSYGQYKAKLYLERQKAGK